jgi:hypothetical protein
MWSYLFVNFSCFSQAQAGQMILDRHTLTLNLVLSVEQNRGSTRFEVSTDSSGRIWTANREHAIKLKKLANQHTLTAIAVDPSDRHIIAFVFPMEDQILSVAEPGNDPAVAVQAMRSPTILALRTDHPRFRALYDLLNRAMRTRTETALAVFPGTGEIEDARLLTSQ